MKLSSLILFLEIIVFEPKQAACTGKESIPDLNPGVVLFNPFIDSYQAVDCASQSAHVTGIELGLLNNNAIYTFKFLGGGVSQTPKPPGCSLMSGSTKTFTLTSD